MDPAYRLSNAERQDALDALEEHVRTGRLDVDEFAERSARVSVARTSGDLIPLFADLPAPRPAVLDALTRPAAAPPPVRRGGGLLGNLTVPVAAVLGVLLFLTVLRGFWPILLLPAIAILLMSLRGKPR
ncbi:DUF1707 SHOCT-like domain-containing protein [Amycolatopsis suaedae]|uniref:DUF1707 domain-containing protein n=1 Tax=Amycolatopsis suaedae TaxID=2510978 RepID=A0A4V2ELU3_9PSEU|nr:DUF1707 domain-containing protein [Amycolatopsis suaedae]RZQ62765.1 DUF1707 domain-containing protein [Amycolatopsis suaedae]